MVSIQSQVAHSFQRFVASAAALLIVCLPLTAALPVSADCNSGDNGAGVHQPVGADAAAFSYDCNSGLWESAHFTFDPTTGEYTPKETPTYICDPATGLYGVSTWVYNAPSGGYVSVDQTVKTPPVGASIIACAPKNSVSPTTNSQSGAINGTGPNSSNNLNNNATNNTDLSNTNNANVTNTSTSSGVSGDATVLGNTTGGGATSGDATVTDNELNLLQSTGNFGLTGKPATFVANIDGDVNGDFLLNPATLGLVQNTGPSSNNASNNNVTNNVNIDNTANTSIANNVNLAAQSGDATVAGNTAGGDATTGDAHAVANIVNVIDSAITAGQSFVGVVNINGNLNGDILLPPDFVDQLLAANVPTVNVTGPGSNNSSNNSIDNNTTVSNTNNLGATNNVTSNAASGAADVSNNTSGGDASTGSAKTNLTAFNLTASNVIGGNDILVFVNVLGSWVGLIVNAPAGTTAASLGGGISNSGPSSNNSSNNTAHNNTAINNTNNDKITNNVNIASKSGNANVTGNTKGGNAHSGDADAAVNLLNVENSNLDLSNWFGVLFINVFGTWNGSFGINTAAGNPITTLSTASGVGPSPFVAFAPTTSGGGDNHGTTGFTTAALGDSTVKIPNSIANAVLAARKVSKAAPTPTLTPTNWLLIVGSTSLFVAYVVGDRLYDLRRR